MKVDAIKLADGLNMEYERERKESRTTPVFDLNNRMELTFTET